MFSIRSITTSNHAEIGLFEFETKHATSSAAVR